MPLKFWEQMLANTLMYDAIHQKRKHRQSDNKKLLNQKIEICELAEMTLPQNCSVQYKYVCSKLLEFVENIDKNISSVESKYITMETKESYAGKRNHNIVASIPLKEHLIRCYFKAIYLHISKPADFIGILAAMSLVHDVGKIPTISALYKNKEALEHDEISGRWVLDFFETDIIEKKVNQEIILLISNTVSMQHHHKHENLDNPSKTKQIVSEYLACLRTTDGAARDEEELIILKKQNSSAKGITNDS